MTHRFLNMGWTNLGLRSVGLPAIPAFPCVPVTPRTPRRGVAGACTGVPVVWDGREGDEGGLARAGDRDAQAAVQQEEGQHASPSCRCCCWAQREG